MMAMQAHRETVIEMRSRRVKNIPHAKVAVQYGMRCGEKIAGEQVSSSTGRGRIVCSSSVGGQYAGRGRT